MSIIIILIAYYYDYRANKKQFVSDLRGGFQFVTLLGIVFLSSMLIFELSFLVSILITVGIILPLGIIVKQLFKKQ